MARNDTHVFTPTDIRGCDWKVVRTHGKRVRLQNQTTRAFSKWIDITSIVKATDTMGAVTNEMMATFKPVIDNLAVATKGAVVALNGLAVAMKKDLSDVALAKHKKSELQDIARDFRIPFNTKTTKDALIEQIGMVRDQ